jgi:hypothetical protein
MVMGFFDSSSTTKSKQWLDMPEWMQGLPQEIASQMQGLLGRDLMSPEDRIAAFSPAQSGAIDQMVGWGQQGGAGNNILQALMSMGQQGSQAFGQGQDMFRQAAGMGQSMNMGPDMGRVGEYANNPYMDSMVGAALRDPARALMEQAMPASSMAQAASGNTRSTRGAIGDAVLQRGFEDRAADISAGMRGSAWGQGLGIEANRAGQNASLQDSYGNRLLSAGQGMVSSGQGAANILGLANSIGLGNINQMLQGGMMNTAQDQAMKDWNFNNYNQPFNDAAWAASIINPMASQYGTHHSRSKTTSTMSPAQFALGAASAYFGMPGGGGMLGGGGGGGGGGVKPGDWFPGSASFLPPY